MNKVNELLPRSVQTLLLLFLIFGGLYFSASFLIPVALAGILAMLFLPFSRWMEKKGVNRTVGAVICVLALIAIVAGFLFLISWRVSNLQANLEQIEQQFNKYLGQAQAFVSDRFGVSRQQQNQMLKKQGSSGAGSAATYVAGFAAGLLSSLTTTVLLLIYIFLLINSRAHFKKFILKLVKTEDQDNAKLIISETTEVAQNYVSGLAKMIFCLWIMYGIGFSIVGVNNAIFFAILCGTLEIIPFVGNLTGTGLTVLMALAQGGGSSMVISVLVTYGLVQFIQSYILQPLVVGKDVDVSPLFTIMVLVLGEAVWGIGGMVLSIPLLGMLKIIFDHIEPLKPYGYLIGNGDEEKKEKPLTGKIKSWFKS
ncbi:AI-2E family transporter [Mucilaginibacter sp. UR6-1]|uniref:AI-2E family transporter n=1 Tax=Mucilaginibacter sp. UR6-1 TaxID=1435643 RepID=UPI001E2FFE0E|nr:AI-2E family transporter [Mucilaginibacter sp. UR6-1]MCC8410772.1 AI-2E family transporter [Mucilaginibacter sp. UR6-1]